MTRAITESARALHLRAEEKLRANVTEPLETLSPEEVKELLHDLRVHQIELEMQNEELRCTQDELECSRSRYFELYDLAPVGYLTLSGQGLILEANIVAATMFGVARGALVKQPISRFIFKEDQDIFYRNRKKLLETGEQQAYELRMVNNYGTAFWVHLSTSAKHCDITNPGQDAEDSLVFSIVINDITERKLAEEEKIKIEVQLSQALRMESIGRLAGGVAHDFNNMLSVIIGHTNLALMDLDASQKLYIHIEEIRKAAERSSDLTRQLLAFARKQTIETKVLNLNEIIAALLTMLERVLGENIKLSWQPKENVCLVKVDPAQINQILVNLCANARDSIKGIGEITLVTKSSLIGEGYCPPNIGFLAGDYVVLTISDTGCGMDKDTLPHIFEPFFTTKGLGKGTGLGLATVYGAVKQNNGFIDVSSGLGQGTTFTIYLPKQSAIVTQERAECQTALADHGHETILLVEDEPSVLSMATMVLVKQGYLVLPANSPGEAVKLAKEHSGEISLLLTDVVMPEMNGWDLAKSLLPLNPCLKCLFMSGYTADIIANHGEVDGGLEFIQKPFSMSELAAKVRSVLDGPTK
jgi:PAS domain S-box-containing protein